MARIPIALQLYSVREDCKQDLPGTLAKVKAMGYEGVEFAGFYDYPAAEIKKMLDDQGLKVAGSHTGWALLQPDKLNETIEYNQAIGNKYIILPGVPEAMRNTKEACLKLAEFLNGVAEKLQPFGMYTGYHNHHAEMKPMPPEVGGPLTPWEVIMGNTKPEVVGQLDIGHCMRGGADPIAMLKRFPGRAKTVHVKEFDPADETKEVGEGIVPWADVFAVCESAVGGTEWYIVEHERYARPPIECVEICIKNLKKMGK
ncbi:MAG TPA: sugar phosphate isomerase/epimerase [Firmicutes bacterium]|nr:sugar phosphate isomerase/epimerase [Bacillota bacterium]